MMDTKQVGIHFAFKFRIYFSKFCFSVALDLDVTDTKSIQKAVETTIREFGQIDILVNNAGITITKPALKYSEKDWDDVINTNLRGAW